MEMRTFIDLETAAGQNYTPTQGDKWPLEEWYDRVRSIPLSQIPVGDLATAIRQEVWVEEVTPLAVRMLEEDPQAGELYEGELMVALKYLPPAYWGKHRDLASTVRTLVKRVFQDFDDELKSRLEELLARMDGLTS